MEVALTLADRDWPVITMCWPTLDGQCGCGRGHKEKEIGKAPLTEHGYHDATIDKKTVAAWWTQWPEANVAVALGPAGLMAIDCDSNDAIQEAFGLGLPNTICRMSRQPAYIYSAPQTTPKTNAIHLGDSGRIDLLGIGYLVVYGRHQNGKEIYLDGEVISPAPAWALEALQEKADTKKGGIQTTEPSDGPPVRLSPIGEDWWYGRLVVAPGDGKAKSVDQVNEIDRSETLFRQGLVLADGNASERLIAEALAERDVTLGYEKYTDRMDDEEY